MLSVESRGWASKLSRSCVKFRSGAPAGAIRSSTCSTGNRFPRYSLVRQGAQHLPRRVATAGRHYEAATCGHRGARLGCNHLDGLLGDGIGIGKDFGLYWRSGFS